MGEKGTVQLTEGGTKAVLLPNANHQIAHSEGIPSKIEKSSEGERTNSGESNPEGEAFFLGLSQKKIQVFFDASPNSEEEKKTEREKKGVTVRPQT